MRKLLALLVLVPFAAVAVLSCDDHPTAPEEAQPATTLQESSAPQAAAKAPTLPTPVMLSDFTLATTPGTALGAGAIDETVILCPSGFVPIDAGSVVENSNLKVLGRIPWYQGDDSFGYRFRLKNEGSVPAIYAYFVSCVRGTVGDPPVFTQ
jgi:hypothetical protein